MNLKEEFQPIRDWAADKGIYDSGDLATQTLKLNEELGELSEAILDKDLPEIMDAIGDMVVVLTSIAELANKEFGMDDVTIENCINGAYEVIAKRTGKMINGTFVKDK